MDVHTKMPNEKLKYQRESRNWTQRKVADLIGASTEMISRWECGERKPSISYQEKLCALFEQDTVALGFLKKPTNTLQDIDSPQVIQLSDDTDYASNPQINSVIDASALIAFLHKEPGSELVAQALHGGAAMSLVNFSEAIGVFSEYGIPENSIHDILDNLGIALIDHDEKQAYEAGSLHLLTKHLDLSLGDRACLALARQLQLPVLTADRAWAKLSLGIEIHVIR